MKLSTLRVTTLDWYIIRKFLGTYFFAIALILSISIVFDIAEKIDDFMSKEAPLREIVFGYYLNFIPYFANLFSSLFIFITVIFFTSKMAARCEIIAILSSGISLRRLLYPYFLSAFFLFLLSIFLSNVVIPPANRTRIDFIHKYVSRPKYNDQYDMHKQVRPGFFVYMESYSPNSRIGYRLALESFENGKLVSKLRANYVEWDTVSQKWQMGSYYIRHYTDSGERIEHGTGLDTTFYLQPSDLAHTDMDIESMNYRQLNQYIADQELQGSSYVNAAYVEKYNRVAQPFAAFILTLIGVSVSARKVRGGMGKHLGFGLGLSFSYILFMRFSTMFAIGSTLSPLLAVWLPNMIFAIVAVVLYRMAPK